MVRRLAPAARWTAGLLTGLAVLSCVSFAVATRGLHYQPVAVYSGSMEPEIPVGGLVFERIVAGSSVRVGDVISFADPFDPARVVTHRVVRILKTSEGPGYRTKGDANPSGDPWTLKLPARVGTVRATVPVAGYALIYGQTREVRTALILLAALTFLGVLLRRIWARPSSRCASAV
jgi:signal peptidase I